MSPAAPSAGDAALNDLIARLYIAQGEDVRKDCDAHWRISERWSYGEPVGWFVEHDGYCYQALEDGEDGPFATRELAVIALEEHLGAAIFEVGTRS